MPALHSGLGHFYCAKHLALFGFQQLPAFDFGPAEAATTEPAPDSRLGRQPGDHTPADAGVWSNKIMAWCKIPGPNSNMPDKNTTNETTAAGTRPTSDPTNHTCCSRVVVLCKNHPTRMNETDARQGHPPNEPRALETIRSQRVAPGTTPTMAGVWYYIRTHANHTPAAAGYHLNQNLPNEHTPNEPPSPLPNDNLLNGQLPNECPPNKHPPNDNTLNRHQPGERPPQPHTRCGGLLPEPPPTKRRVAE
ncbi:hypothetical protein BS47DRAFT_1365655 [Hydnum rufescens UP504]|uniref:Uncharacterized protein n=1 Tax=Hydnum rufescens UP504 TaxID=1448309 RepID=A0A9P6AN29_9AGAM|nr:hypothetical protein BS47DRAFT_1365655 [Hydnum rufescens UP504]